MLPPVSRDSRQPAAPTRLPAELHGSTRPRRCPSRWTPSGLAFTMLDRAGRRRDRRVMALASAEGIDTYHVYAQDGNARDATALPRSLGDSDCAMELEPLAGRRVPRRGLDRLGARQLRAHRDSDSGRSSGRRTAPFLGDCGLMLQPVDGELVPAIGYHIVRRAGVAATRRRRPSPAATSSSAARVRAGRSIVGPRTSLSRRVAVTVHETMREFVWERQRRARSACTQSHARAEASPRSASRAGDESRRSVRAGRVLVAPALAAPVVLRQRPLAEADRGRRDLDSSSAAMNSIADSRVSRPRRRQPERLVVGVGPDVRELLLLRRVDVHVARSGVLADDHPLVDLDAGADEQLGALLEVEQAVGVRRPGPVARRGRRSCGGSRRRPTARSPRRSGGAAPSRACRSGAGRDSRSGRGPAGRTPSGRGRRRRSSSARGGPCGRPAPPGPRRCSRAGCRS